MSNSNRPPKLNFDLLTSEDLPGQSESWPEHLLPVHILFLTGETCELLSCLSHLKEGSIYKSYKKAIGHVFFGKVGEQNESMTIAVMESCVDATDTSLTVVEAIKMLGPKAVFCIGYCGGLDDMKVKLGDVVISKMVRTYASVSVMVKGIEDRNVGVPVPSLIGGIMKRADDNWMPPLENPGELDPVRHKEGVFLSGPEEVNNKERCDELLKHFPDAIAIERQGDGIYKAAHRRNIQWAVIKGVSNFIDGREPNTDSWRQFASALAASLAFNILKDFYVFNQWPNYKSPSKKSWSKKKKSCPTAGYQGSKQAPSQTRPLVQGQPVPCASPMIATCTSTLPTAAQTQMAVGPQAQPSVLTPTQQQVSNNQMLHASPGVIPVQGIAPQVVAQNPTQHQSGMVATTPGLPGQVDVNTAASHGVPTVQPVVNNICEESSAQRIVVMLQTQSSKPQLTTAGQTTAQQLFFHPPAGTRLQTADCRPFRTTSHQQYHWSLEGSPVVSTLQLFQNTSLQGGTPWPQCTKVATPQPLMNVQPGNVYGQYRQHTLQYQTQQPQQTAAVLKSKTVVYYQQPKQVQQQHQQQQKQQPPVLLSLMDIVPGASHQGSSVVTATGAPTNALSVSSDAPAVMYNSPQVSQLVQQQHQQQQKQQPRVLPSLMDIVPGAPHQGSSVVTATGAPTNALSVSSDAPAVMYNSPQVSLLQVQQQHQQQQKQQPPVLPSLMDIVPGAPHQGSSVVTATGAPTNALSVSSDAPAVMYNSPQVSLLVNTTGWYPQPSQKRAADGDARQQRPAGFHKANKRLRF